jgi:hypothetical protein
MAITKQEPVVQRLPTSYVTGIGRVISRWAYLEWLISRMTYEALGVNPKQGRLAVRQARPDEYVTLIQDLLKTRKLSVPIPDPDPTLKARLRKAKAARDYLAHGLWTRHRKSGELGLWLIKGEQPSSASDPAQPRNLSKRSGPAAKNSAESTPSDPNRLKCNIQGDRSAYRFDASF